MKILTIIFLLALISCKRNETVDQPEVVAAKPDTIETVKPNKIEPQKKTYSNARFRDVAINASEDGSFTVTGKAQVFEASFSWVIEDGHNELDQGHEMTNAGAPEWGDFKFSIKPEKAEQNSTLTLILFEASAMDGSRQHELAIPLF